MLGRDTGLRHDDERVRRLPGELGLPGLGAGLRHDDSDLPRLRF